MGTFVLEDDNL